MAKATLAIASKNYGSWSLRGWLLCKMAGLDFEEVMVSSDDPSTRAELLLLLNTHGFKVISMDEIEICEKYADIPGLHEQCNISMYAVAA